MESRHDFIQWMFPLEEPSQFNPDAPILTLADREAFDDDPVLRDNLLQSFDRFLDLPRAGTRRRIESSRRRISRRSSGGSPSPTTTGCGSPASWPAFDSSAFRPGRGFHQGLESLIEQGKARITADTRAYWKNATFPDQPR